MTHPKLATAMMKPAFYPECPRSVELVQTHISYVFIAGDFVYKIKKPVNFGFLDFTSLSLRKHYCEEELRLNRRLAPEAYLAVVPIFEDDSGELRLAEGSRVVEYAVKMTKLPQDRMLKVLLREGKTGKTDMEAIAAKVADFHAHAATGGEIDQMGKVETIRFNCEENFEQTIKYRGVTLSEDKYSFLKEYVGSFLEEKRGLLDRRVDEHRIRDCHGDLHLEHICLRDGIIIFDCIEFNDRFRYSDVASEIAFLAMDLDFNDHPEYAEDFIKGYIARSGDNELKELLNFYKCYRAYVRGKVLSFRLEEPAISARERNDIGSVASRYFDLAFTYASQLEKPTLVLISGLMGTGKSVLARNIAPRLGASILRSDALRKEMMKIPPGERRFEEFGAGLYSDKISQETYALVLKMAEGKLREGKSVIIDASYKRREEREKAQRAASELGADFFVIECVCPEAEIRKRLEMRMTETGEPSDGRWEIFASQKTGFEAIEEFSQDRHIVIDTSLSPEACAMETLCRIRFGTQKQKKRKKEL